MTDDVADRTAIDAHLADGGQIHLPFAKIYLAFAKLHFAVENNKGS